MTRYKLPEQIDHVDSTKPLIDDTVIKGSYKIVASVEERNLIPILKRSLHSLVTIVGDVIKEFIGATTDDTDWLEDSNWRPFTVLPGVVYIDDGQSITIKDADTGATMAEIDRNGQFKSYGREGVANGSFNTYTYDGYIRIEQNTLQGNFYLKMYDFDNNLKVHIDTAGISTLQGLSVADNNLTDVKELQFSNDITFTEEQKEAMPIGTTFWDSVNKTLTTKTGIDTFLQHGEDVVAKSANLSDLENRQTAVNNLFDATNLALGQTLVKDINGNMVAGEAGAVKSVNGQTGDVVIDTPFERYETSESTVTSGVTTILTINSKFKQIFTGTNAQGVRMPVVSTLIIGFDFNIINESTQTIIVMSSGSNTIVSIPSKMNATLNCVAVTGTDATSWGYVLNQNIPTVLSGEKILSATSSGVKTNYDAIEMIVSVGSMGSANWSSGTITSTGVQGQVAYDSSYRYDCVSTDTWRRTTLNYDTINLYAGTIDDSTTKTSSDLQTAFPSSVIGQRVRGINFIYEKYDNTLWFKSAITNI